VGVVSGAPKEMPSNSTNSMLRFFIFFHNGNHTALHFGADLVGFHGMFSTVNPVRFPSQSELKAVIIIQQRHYF